MNFQSMLSRFGRELRGIGRLGFVVGIAGIALLLPSITLAQSSMATTFFSPPPGNASISMQMSKVAQSLNGIEVRALVAVKCSGFAYPPTVNATFTVLQVDQNVVRSVSGFVTPSIVCDNVSHVYQGVATVNSGSTPLAKGAAVIQANVNACGTNIFYIYQCAQGFASHAITLK